MRILLISFMFPPYNNIGAIRVGKMAKYLHEFGHSVKVISAGQQPFDKSLNCEVPAESVVRTSWIDVNRFGRRTTNTKGSAKLRRENSALLPTVRNRLKSLYRNFFNIPDEAIGWYPFGVSTAAKAIHKHQPDVIYASGGPMTTLLIASWVAGRHKIPWVAELRDLWSDNQDYKYSQWRKGIDAWLENWALRHAASLITVSEPLAETLRARHNKQVDVILNGFDPPDFPSVEVPSSFHELTLVYTGWIYPRQQDVSPLFTAVQSLISTKSRLKIIFYGVDTGWMDEQVQHFNLQSVVETHERISYADAVRHQAEADINLFLLWNDITQTGIYSGKLFEYIGARRPILAIGTGHDLAAKLIIERKLGVVLSDPKEIATQLTHWLNEKATYGRIAGLNRDGMHDFTRREQARQLENVLHRAAG